MRLNLIPNFKSHWIMPEFRQQATKDDSRPGIQIRWGYGIFASSRFIWYDDLLIQKDTQYSKLGKIFKFKFLLLLDRLY